MNTKKVIIKIVGVLCLLSAFSSFGNTNETIGMRILTFFILIILGIICLFGSYIKKTIFKNQSESNNISSNQNDRPVYIVHGSHKYHTTLRCSALQNIKSNIQTVSFLQARSKRYQPCQKCMTLSPSPRHSTVNNPPTPTVPPIRTTDLQEPIIEQEIEIFRFKVAGVTFKTDGKNRQTILRKIKFRDPPFSNHVNVELIPYDYEGEQAYSVSVDGIQVGNVPREHIEFIHENLNRLISAIINVYGGQNDHSLGAEVVLRLKK